ncbi:MAG: type I-G CRISPR-associated RAMP protein Csb1/Cas7g [Thermoguttaceae bacterium]
MCLIIKARLKPIGDTYRFQPAGFPEVGHVIYDAPRTDHSGNHYKEKICIVDSPASMANHLETVCIAGTGAMELHPDLKTLPYVICQTDGDVDVVSTFTEGHRLASDYFLDATLNDTPFRQVLRNRFQIVEVKKDKTYFIPPAKWWEIFKTIFGFDPNSLVHGVMFAKEQIKISRLLTAHLEAFGVNRVGRSGVKFDRLGKTTSGQPIFSVDEETAQEIRATFIIDLALLRSYGRGDNGLSDTQKALLLDLALWKIRQLLARPFRYRTQCCLGCDSVIIETESGVLEEAPQRPDPNQHDDAEKATTEIRVGKEASNTTLKPSMLLNDLPPLLATVNIKTSIEACKFENIEPVRVYYPADQLYKAGKEDSTSTDKGQDESAEETEE